MASWREIDRIRKDPRGFRDLAKRLIAVSFDELSPWELDFLESIAALTKVEEFTTRQSEKLLEIRDNAQILESFHGFSIATLIQRCWEARLDLSEDDETWITQLRAGERGPVRRRSVGRLVRCARAVGLIDDDLEAA